MRILDQKNDQSINQVVLYLTKEEALELKDSLDGIIEDNNLGRHEHVSSSEYDKEITVCLYDPGSIEQFSERSKKLIRHDL